MADGGVHAHGVIEVAGVKGNPGYRANLKQKELALVPVGVPFLELDNADDLDQIPAFIASLEKQVANKAASLRASSTGSTGLGAYVTASGRHIDPRGIKKKLQPGEIRKPLPSMYPEPPADEVRSSMPVMTPEERELQRAKDALWEQRYEEVQKEVVAVRARFKAEWAEQDAKATDDQRGGQPE